MSRKFVCVRIETFENKESESLVKRVLGGQLANTAFAILNPDGTSKLTPGSRSPGMSLANKRTDTTGKDNKEIIRKLNRIAGDFESVGEMSEAILQDFHSLRQALNCASADQRLLVVINADDSERESIQSTLQNVFTNESVMGKFHLNFLNAETDQNWQEVLSGTEEGAGIMLVRSGQFGVDGEVLARVAIDAGEDKIKAALLEANQEFASVEVRKDYDQHVRAGRRDGVEFENEIPTNGSDGTSGRRGKRQRKRGRDRD